MKSYFLSDEPEQAMCLYDGVPRSPDRPQERTKWRKFLALLLPWLNRKRELGDEYLEAQVLEKRATALRAIAEAEAKHQEAHKLAAETAEIAQRLEETKLEQGVVRVDSSVHEFSLLDAEIAELQDQLVYKIREARLRYGTRVLALPEKAEAPKKTESTTEPYGGFAGAPQPPVS